MKPAPTLLLLALLAVSAAGEEIDRTPAAILARLDSTEPAEVAWGAYLAGQERVAAAIPALIRALRPNPSRTGDDWAFTTRSTLDALIRLNAKVPGDVLAPHLRGGTTLLALILLARDPARNRGLLSDLFDRWVGKRERVHNNGLLVGNLLVSIRAPGVAVRLLPHVAMKLELAVHGEGPIRIHGGGSDLFSGRGDGRVTVPAGFPPYAIYRLLQRADGPGEVVLVADGTRPVVYQRTERSGTRIGFGGRVERSKTTECAREWLATMVGTSVKGLGLPETTTRWHEFETPDAYRTWAVRQRDDQLNRYWTVVRLLIDRKLMTVAEARTLAPKLEVVIDDQRKDGSVALPELPPTTVTPRLPEERPPEVR